MLLSSIISFIYKDGVTSKLILSGITVMLLGVFVMLATKNHRKEMNKREGYIVVAFGCVITSYSIHYTKLYEVVWMVSDDLFPLPAS